MKEYRKINNHYGIKTILNATIGIDIPSNLIVCNWNDFKNDAIFFFGYDENLSEKYHGFCIFTIGDGKELAAYYDYYYDFDTNELYLSAELYSNDGHLMGKC